MTLWENSIYEWYKRFLFTEGMLDQQGNGHADMTMVEFRRYRNLLQTNRQKGRLR